VDLTPSRAGPSGRNHSRKAPYFIPPPGRYREAAVNTLPGKWDPAVGPEAPEPEGRFASGTNTKEFIMREPATLAAGEVSDYASAEEELSADELKAYADCLLDDDQVEMDLDD